MTETYRVNSNDIMHETIDGEVVIVNLESGAYYAFDGSGEFIWNRLSEEGASRQQLLAELQARYAADAPEIETAVEHFIAQLLDEQLIVADSMASAPAAATGERLQYQFVAPQLNKYTDMEALLLADPIHEVEAEGWPNLK